MAGGSSDYLKVDVTDETGTQLHTGKITVTSMRAWAPGAATTADIFVQIFDALAANVTVGTTIPTWVLLIPDGDNMSSGDGLPTDGLIFETGIFVAATALVSNNTAPQQDPTTRITIR